MNKNKKLAVFGLLFFIIFQAVFLIPINAQVVDIWGVSEGSKKSYDYYQIYAGTISGTTNHPRRSYTVSRIFDSDDNNYTECLLQIDTIGSDGLQDLFIQVLDDSSGSWANSGLRPSPANYYYFNPLYPIMFNNTDSIGFNWSRSLEQYNTGINNWNMTILENIATINQSTNGTESGADFNLTIMIKWDINSGWLVSYDYLKEYNETLGYSIQYQTVVYVPSDGFVIDFGTLFGIIAIILGCIAVIFTILAYKRSRNKPRVKEPKVEVY
jgi:hypothetical protein